MKTIDSRKDISLLVNTFYNSIRQDEVLGPIFNTMIAQDRWPEHLEKLMDFWETNLFGVPKFKGNPVEAHLRTDREFKIEQAHFERWVRIWTETIDGLFIGERAERAKHAAQRMSIGQYLAVLRFR